jgi:hypothetical protein
MANSKILAYSVTLWNPESATYETFLPGSELPAWAAGLVKNPVAFEPEYVQPTAGTEDMVVPGPSQLPMHTNTHLVTKNRMETGSGMERGSGQSIRQDTVRMGTTVNPQPSLHDEVAKAAMTVQWTTNAGAEAFKLRTGAVPSDQDVLNAEHLVEDQAMNLKAEEQQKVVAADLAAAAYEEAMAVQAQAAVQSAAAFSSVPGATEALAAKAPAKKAAAPKKEES